MIRSNVGFVDLQHVAVAMGVAGIVDHDVDAAEGVHGRTHHLVELGSLRDVGLTPQIAAVADLAGDALGALGVQIGDDDPGALLGEAPRHAFAEAGGRAGDDRNLVFQTPACSAIPTHD